MTSPNGDLVTNEIELIDIYNIVKRQFKFFIIAFLIYQIFIILFAVTRPTLWQASVSLIIGENLLRQQQIENSDEIKYRYSKSATITPVRNTRIIEITVSDQTKDDAFSQIEKIKNELILQHKQLLDEKRNEIMRLINSTGKDVNIKELLEYIDSASNLNVTKQINDINVEQIRFSGFFHKSYGIFSFIGLIVIGALSILKDYLEKNVIIRSEKE
jgi:uncharacterized protein involved in exopolysaccharide biosynthesis